jgi:thiol-disulfide isomerase/thioredoxin
VLIVIAVAVQSNVPKTASDAPMYAHLEVGQPAPAFSAATTHGPFSFPTGDHKPVFLEVFATWCPHCQHEVSVINPLFARYGDKVHFVAISGSQTGIDGKSPSSQVDVMNFVQREKVGYPVAYDPDLTVAKKYLQGGYPTLVIIDRGGKIASVRDGEISGKVLSDDLDKALKS